MTDEDYTAYLKAQMANQQWGPLAEALMRAGALRTPPLRVSLWTPLDATDRQFLRSMRIKWEA